jgi:hypothetical protein
MTTPRMQGASQVGRLVILLPLPGRMGARVAGPPYIGHSAILRRFPLLSSRWRSLSVIHPTLTASFARDGMPYAKSNLV